MRSNANYINIDAGILSSVVLFGAYRTAEAAEEESPDTIRLTGTVRDFKERTAPGGHPDFERQPDHGFGVYSGNVGLFLGPEGRPVFSGQGRKINQDARDAEGRSIAPHMANRRFEAVSVDWAYDCGVYSDQNSNEAAQVCLVSATFEPDGTSTWVYHVSEIAAGKNLKQWRLKLAPGHNVVAGTTPGYSIGTDSETGLYGIKWSTPNSFNDGVFIVVLDGHYVGDYADEGAMAKCGTKRETARLFVPTTVEGGASPIAEGDALVGDATLDDDEASASYSDTGAIESAESFSSWYHDVLGLNLSKPLELTLTKQEDGSYVFDDKEDELYASRGGFFPIEDDLFGNPGGNPDRNFHFTYELHTEFTYDADGDQIFKFIGDDDVWVYIDGKLAIDLGGVHAAHEQHADLNRMGLVDGETYTLDFFFAERHRTQSNFRIETNLKLQSNPMKVPSMTMAFD